MARSAGAALVLSLGLLGCASTPPPQASRQVLPERYPEPTVLTSAVPGPSAGAAPQADIGLAAAAIAWREYFTDPGLQSLIEQALAYNREVRLAALSVEEARVAFGLQKAERIPTISALFDRTRTAVPGDLSLTRKPMITDQVQGGLVINRWEIDFWGRLSSLSEAARQQYLATDAARRAVTVGLIAQVAQSYLSLCELDERIALARRTVDSRAESLRIFRRRVELGATSRLELTQVELLWRQATALVAQLEQARAAQAHALTLLVGGAPSAASSPRRLAELTPLAPLRAGLPSDLLLNRPDIVAAEHAMEAAHANIRAVRASFFPRISLTALFGSASADLVGLFHAGSRAWVFNPTITTPVFSGGRYRSSMDLAELRRDHALVQYEHVIQSAFRDVSDALSAHRWLLEKLGTLDATASVQAERARLAKLRYDAGSARYLEVLDAERDLLALEQQRVQVRGAVLQAQVGLYAALGGGSQQLPLNPIGHD